MPFRGSLPWLDRGGYATICRWTESLRGDKYANDDGSCGDADLSPYQPERYADYGLPGCRNGDNGESFAIGYADGGVFRIRIMPESVGVGWKKFRKMLEMARTDKKEGNSRRISNKISYICKLKCRRKNRASTADNDDTGFAGHACIAWKIQN